MAFLRYAYAKDVRLVNPRAWGKVRVASTGTFVSSSLVEQASDILHRKFDPSDYLLTHATIVASVDTYDVPDVRIGSVNEGTFKIQRKYADYGVRPETDPFLNNNNDGWERKVLLKSYQTFIGGHNFCFVPGTKVQLGDGSYKPIEDIREGDVVFTHEGRTRKVTQTFVRDFEGQVRAIRVGRYKDPILVTGNHPFRVLQVQAKAPKRRQGSKASSQARYYRDQVVRALRGDKHSLQEFQTSPEWLAAEDLENGAYVLSPNLQAGSVECPERATLLGYYLAEGCQLRPDSDQGVCFTFGPHEKEIAEHALKLAQVEFDLSSSRIYQTPTSWRVDAFGQEIARWMRAYGGHLAAQKRVSEDVFLWSRESLLRLLAGWLTGDGDFHTETFRLRGATVSEDLCQQMCLVASLCGVKSCVVFEKQAIGEVVSSVSMVVGGESRQFDVVPRSHKWTLLVSRDSASPLLARSARWGLHTVGKKREDFCWWKQHRVFQIRGNSSLPYSGKVYNFEVEEDHSYVVSPGIAVHNCEHIQLEEQSKGRILDACARDIGDSVYVDILIATDQKHKELISSIQSGEMSTLSMGCSIDESTCTKCGHVAVDEPEMCTHVRYEKGNYFYDEQGMRRRVAELCGHHTLDPTGGVHFIEGSWVGVPAFGGAVLRTILSPDSISSENLKRAEAILLSPPKVWSSENLQGIAKAATLLAAARKVNAFDFGGDDEGDDEEGGGGGDEKAILEELEDTAKSEVVRRIKKKIREEINPPKPGPNMTKDTITDENVNRQAAHRRWVGSVYRDTINTVTKMASSDAALINGVAQVNNSFGIEVPVEIYRAALRVGTTTRYHDLKRYLRACGQTMGRTPTQRESITLVRLSNLLARLSG